jgi:hypothetical protein
VARTLFHSQQRLIFHSSKDITSSFENSRVDYVCAACSGMVGGERENISSFCFSAFLLFCFSAFLLFGTSAFRGLLFQKSRRSLVSAVY